MAERFSRTTITGHGEKGPYSHTMETVSGDGAGHEGGAEKKRGPGFWSGAGLVAVATLGVVFADDIARGVVRVGRTGDITEFFNDSETRRAPRTREESANAEEGSASRGESGSRSSGSETRVEVLADPNIRVGVTILNVPEGVQNVHVPMVVSGTNERIYADDTARESLSAAIASVRARMVQEAGNDSAAAERARSMELGGAVWDVAAQDIPADRQVVVNVPSELTLSIGGRDIEDKPVVAFGIRMVGTSEDMRIQPVTSGTPEDMEVNFGEEPRSGPTSRRGEELEGG